MNPRIIKSIKWITGTFIVLYLLLTIGGPVLFLNVVCDKHVNHQRVFAAEEFGIPVPDTLYLNTLDGFSIHTIEVSPEDSARGVIIFVSGIENPSVTAFYGHVKPFREMGLVSLLPDVRGHGKSDGDRICLAFEEDEDIIAVARYASMKYPGLPVIVMGLSMGGGIAIRSAASSENIDAVVTLSAFSSVQDVVGGMLGNFITPVLAAPAKLSTALCASLKYRVNAFTDTPLDAASRLGGKPVLMMHSRGDTQVPYKCFEKLSDRIRHDGKSRIETYVVDGDRHFIIDRFLYPCEDSEYFSRLKAFIESVLQP
ncbi:MAG: alpha/beta hydrolase [Candidatus Cryptobacteroides sp.]